MKTFFYLQRNDRRAIMATLIVLTVAVGLTIYIGDEGKTAATTQADSTATAPNRNQGNGGGQQAVAYYDTGGRRAELFPFDPNTADSTQLLRLGLAPWQVRNIYKYRAAGGEGNVSVLYDWVLDEGVESGSPTDGGSVNANSSVSPEEGVLLDWRFANWNQDFEPAGLPYYPGSIELKLIIDGENMGEYTLELAEAAE